MKIARYTVNVYIDVLIEDDEDPSEYETRVAKRNIEKGVIKLLQNNKYHKDVDCEVMDVEIVDEIVTK